MRNLQGDDDQKDKPLRNQNSAVSLVPRASGHLGHATAYAKFDEAKVPGDLWG